MLTAFVLFAALGCRKESTTVAVIPRTTTTPLWESLHAGVGEAARDSGLQIRWDAPADEGDTERQLATLDASIARRDRGIIFAPDETLASRSLVLRATNNSIPVVVVDDEFGPPAGPLLSYVSNDEQVGARLAAERLTSVLHGRGSIAIIGINPRREGELSREELFEHELSRLAPQIQVGVRRFGDSVITHQQQIAQELLRGSAHLDAIVALSATATRGAYYARLAMEPHPQVVIIGFDQDLLLPVGTGEVDAVIAQDTKAIGRIAMQEIAAMLRGVAGSKTILVPPLLVTRETLDSPRLERFLPKYTGDAESRPMLIQEAKRHELQPGVQPIVDFLMRPGQHPNVTIEGVVISVAPLLEVQDDSGAMMVASRLPDMSVQAGDIVAVHGTVVSERFRSRMEDAQIDVLWSDRPVPPLAVTAAQLTAGAYRGRSVEVEGTVLSDHTSAGTRELVLHDGDQTFRALMVNRTASAPVNFEPGSRLRMGGTASALPRLTDGMYPFTVVADRVELLSTPPWWSAKHIFWIGLVLAATLLGMQWLLHSIQRWHLRSVLREREQLAFELHDTLAQSFTGIAYQLQAASAEQRGLPAIRTHIANALEMVHLSHREASGTIAALRPQYRDAPGILAALRQMAERLSDGGGLAVQTALRGRVTDLPLEITDAFFRIGQEAISNAIQHSQCKTLAIELNLSRREAQLTVKDDGIGFDPGAQHVGLGIAGMRKRADKIKARLDISSTPRQGTVLRVITSLRFGSTLFRHA